MYIFIILIFIFPVLPIFLWPHTRKLAVIVIILYTIKIYTLFDLISGVKTLCHDSYYTNFFFALVRDWHNSHIPMDWNPYFSAGQPFAVITNFTFWIPVIILSKLTSFLSFDIPSSQFTVLFYFYLFFQFCSGTILLLQLLFRSKIVTIFGAISIIFGGFMQESIYGPTGLALITFIPYLLFFLIHAFKSGRWNGILFFSLFLGGALNHYNPIYFMLFAIIFFPALILFSWKKIFLRAKNMLTALPFFPLACALFFLTTFSTSLNGFLEMGDYVSPTRGYTLRGKITASSVGFQPGVSAPLNEYTILFDKTFTSSEVTVPGHHGFYIGTLPFLLLFLAPILFFRNAFMRALVITTVCLAILGAGKHTPAWGWVIRNIPLANVMRHPGPLAQLVSWLCLIIAMGGLKLFLDRNISQLGKWFSLVLASFILLAIKSSVDINTFFEILGGVFALAIAILLTHEKFDLNSRDNWIAAILISFNVFAFGSYSLANNRPTCFFPKYSLKKMNYPSTWQSACTHCKAILPFDLWPLIDKEIVWSNPNDDLMIMMQKDFGSFFLKYIRPSGLFYGNIFHILPTKDSWKPDYPDFTRKQYLGQFYMLNSKSNFEEVAHHEMRPTLNLSTVGQVEALSSENPNQISLTTKSAQSSYLLRMENFHSGWKAFVDDTEVKIDRVPPNFQMIPVPAGNHRITFKFHTIYPLLVEISTFATILGWALMLYWLKNGASGRFFKTADEIKSKKFMVFLSTSLMISILMTWVPLPATSSPDKEPSPPLPPTGESYYDNGHYKNFNVNNAFDDDQNTFWHSPFPAKKLGWIVRHFDTPRNIPTFTITARSEQSGQSPTDFTVSGSNDGTIWELLGISSKLKWSAGETKFFSIRGNKNSYSFYKFDFLDSEDKSFVSVADIKLYEKEADQLLLFPTLSVETSLIAEKESAPPVTKIYASGNLNGFPAEYAFDGDRRTMWHSPEPQASLGWLMPWFSKPIKLSRFTMSIRPDLSDQAPDVIYVYGSNDGKIWDELGFSGRLKWKNGETKQFAFNNMNQRYHFYKFDFPATKGKTFISITDISMYEELQEPTFPNDLKKTIAVKENKPVLTEEKELPVLAEEGYKGYNIIWYDGLYYGISQAEGPIDIGQIKSKARYPWFADDSIAEVESKISNNTPSLINRIINKVRAIL